MVTFPKPLATRGSVWGRKNPGPLVAPASSGSSSETWALAKGYFDPANTGTGVTISANGIKVSGLQYKIARLTGAITQKSICHLFYSAGSNAGSPCLVQSGADVESNPTASVGTYTYYGADGRIYYNGGNDAYGNTFTTGKLLSIAFDPVAFKLWFAIDGVWQNSGNPLTGTNGYSVSNAYTYYFAAGDIANSAQTFYCTGKPSGYS